MLLDETSALTNAGSLLSSNDEIVASYDLEVSNAPAVGYRALGLSNGICNAAIAAFNPDFASRSRVHVINGMGVTLGDSIIGLTALYAISAQFPQLRFTIYRPRHAPHYVRRLYELAAPLFGDIVELPIKLVALPQHELRVDMGNHLFWPEFTTRPMIDFFIDAMGMRTEEVSSAYKRNLWMQQLVVPEPRLEQGEYVLLCPHASTPVRSIPASLHSTMVEALWQRFGLPVAGVGAIDHPQYVDVSARSVDIADFIGFIKDARHLVAPDTAAIHIAAGFNVPTTAFFTTIAPQLRVRDYPYCKAVRLDVPALDGMHASSRQSDVQAIEDAYCALKIDASIFDFT
jgi:hypothetical protein